MCVRTSADMCCNTPSNATLADLVHDRKSIENIKANKTCGLSWGCGGGLVCKEQKRRQNDDKTMFVITLMGPVLYRDPCLHTHRPPPQASVHSTRLYTFLFVNNINCIHSFTRREACCTSLRPRYITMLQSFTYRILPIIEFSTFATLD